MKNIPLILLLTICLILEFSCNPEKIKTKYYIVSEDHTKEIITIENGDTIYSPPPPPPPPYLPGLKWYSDYVFIMDSTDLVYIYQTENIHLKKEEHLFSLWFPGDVVKNDTLIYKYDFPNYIGLRPEYMIAVESKNLLSFIKLNNDFFQLDSNKSPFVFLYIASNKDTIKNPAYYELKKLMPSWDYKKCMIAFITRKTTEEEDMVIYYKRRNMKYIPENTNWTTNFINGKAKPFTKEYDKIESKTMGIIKAKETFKINWIKNAVNKLE